MNNLDPELEILYRTLDQTPEDHNLLRAIADRHFELETGLGLGLKACIECERVPWYWISGSWGWFGRYWCSGDYLTQKTALCQLPPLWLQRFCNYKPNRSHELVDTNIGIKNSGAHKAYLAAAKAFNLLTPEQQTRLLAGDLS